MKASMRGELVTEIVKQALEEVQKDGVEPCFNHVGIYIQRAIEKEDL
jgi:hypothetical protein